MARRYCMSCGTKLPGKGHGWVKGSMIVCGRRQIEMGGYSKPAPARCRG